jgi:hypothetical protein
MKSFQSTGEAFSAPAIENIQHFKTWVGHFCLPGLGSGSTYPNESGSETMIAFVVDIFYCCLAKLFMPEKFLKC